jgi:hypothetical protein
MKKDYVRTKLKILIAIPTYHRVDNVTTIDLFDDPVLFVDSFELEAYKKKYPSVKIVEFKGGTGIVEKRNAMLDYGRAEKYDAIWEIDDDFLGIVSFSSGFVERSFDKALIYQVIERMAVMARDCGTPLFITSQVADIRKYKRSEPFSLFATMKLGAHGLFLDNDLRYDNRISLKEDIDMCLQVLMDYRVLFQENRYSFICQPTMNTKGGCASYRTLENEKNSLDILRRKWGDTLFSKSSSKRLSNCTINISNPFK